MAEHWHLTAAIKIEDREKKIHRVEFQEADAVFSCTHRVLLYKLTPGRALEYYLPEPVCVACGPYYRERLFKTQYGTEPNV